MRYDGLFDSRYRFYFGADKIETVAGNPFDSEQYQPRIDMREKKTEEKGQGIAHKSHGDSYALFLPFISIDV